MEPLAYLVSCVEGCGLDHMVVGEPVAQSAAHSHVRETDHTVRIDAVATEGTIEISAADVQ